MLYTKLVHHSSLHDYRILIYPQTYAAQPGPYQEKAKQIYSELRTNVVKNVVKVCSIVTGFYCILNDAVGIRKDWVCLGTIRRCDGRGQTEVRIVGNKYSFPLLNGTV